METKLKDLKVSRFTGRQMRKVILFFSFPISVFCLLLSVLCPLANANNIAVSNVTITGQNTSASTCKVKFDIAWDNSWRNAINYDAAWVFVKYSTDSGTTWAHATLKTSGTNPTNFSQGSGTGLNIVVPTDKKGAFLQRPSNGVGSVSTTGIQLVWDWGVDKLSSDGITAITAGTQVRVKVFGIEMVYVPTGAFTAGDGASDASQFTVTSINTGDATTAPSGGAGGYPTGQTVPANASWPNGYTTFYCMKYELSQQGWVDFFNTLTAAQQTTRDITSASGKNSDAEVGRNTISWTSGNASVGAKPYVVCNYLIWADLAAYADWTGLRPMTELEYEKAARGPTAAVNGEYAWGSTSVTLVTGISNSGASNETASNAGANCVNLTPNAPLRGGFAATASTTRVQAGASYYGIMELSGNLWETIVSIGDGTGRAFTGLHGDGALDASGDANVTNWPGTNGTGAGWRGGTGTYARISDRSLANYSGVRYLYSGIRCVRTA